MQVHDLTGQKCPLPLMRTRALCRKMAPGETIQVLADDPQALYDFREYFEASKSFRLTELETSGSSFGFLIQRQS